MNVKRTTGAAALLLWAALALPANAENSPWLSKVYEYRPAPGQFVNELPEYEAGDTPESMAAKAAEYICGERAGAPVSLGAWGGYITVGFDHRVVNVAGEPDFKIYGNSFEGSAEPGVVEVSVDTNGNGLPDDPWYRLRGSEDDNPATDHGFSAVYYRPAPDAADERYIRMTDSAGGETFVRKVDYHTQSYWPGWLTDEATLAFSGTRLPGNAVENGGIWVLEAFGWGYADNLPNAAEKGFDIGNAVDEAGEPANLPGADFIRIRTGVNQQCGMLGETSTEICGGEDLHPAAGSGVAQVDAGSALRVATEGGKVVIDNDGTPVPYRVLTADGVLTASGTAAEGRTPLGAAECGRGVRIVAAGGVAVRVVVGD